MSPRVLLVTAGMLLLTLLGSAQAANAQSAAEPEGRTTAEVVAIDGIVGEDGRAAVTVRVANGRPETVDEVRVRVTVHDQTRSRYALAQAVDAGQTGPARQVVEAREQALDPEEEADVRLLATAADLGLEGATPGVYPATVSVLDEHGTAEEWVTALVVPQPGGEPLRLAVLLELQGPVAMRHPDRYESAALRASAVRAQRLSETLVHPLSTTLVLDGRTLEELRALADGQLPGHHHPELVEQAGAALDALAEVASRPQTEVVAHAYGPADLVALIRAGLAGEAQRLVDRGQAIADELSGDEPARTRVVVPARGLDPPTAGWLSGVARGTVLTESQLGLDPERDLPATPPAVRTLAGIPGLPVAVPDPLMALLLSRAAHERQPALGAQRVLAESAAVFFERPGGSAPRGLVLAPSRGQAAQLVPALADLLDGAVWLDAVPLSTLLDDVAPHPDPETLAYRVPQRTAELPASYLRELHQAADRLDPLGGVLGEEAVAGLDRRLDTAASVGFRGAPLRRHGEGVAATVQDLVARVEQAITVVEGPPLTLTGIEGTVPVTLASNEDQALNVRVRVLTTRYSVEDEAGRDLVLPPQDEVTTTFDVRAHAPGGTYPVAVEVTDPSGRMALTTGQVVVRSTAVSIAALAVTGGAALFLAASVLHALVRRRRGRGAGPGGRAFVETEPAATGGSR